MNDSHDITQDLNAKKSDSTDEDMENLSDDGKWDATHQLS